MSDAMQNLLNRIIANKLLPSLNSQIGGLIRKNGLDPFPKVAAGKESAGFASASYQVYDLTGLSSVEVTKLAITSVASGGDSSKLQGTMAMAAKLNSALSVRVKGKASAIGIGVGLGGSAELGGVTVASGGTFQAATKGAEICLNDLDATGLSVDWLSQHISIDGLGPLNSLLAPLEQAVLGALKDQIRSLISNQVASVLNDQLDDLLPQCTSIV